MRSLLFCISFTAGLLLAPSMLFAAELEAIDRAFEQCLKKDSTTSTQVDCGYKYSESLDAELNRTYKLLLAKLGEKERKALQSAQKAWLLFRDTEFSSIDALYYENLHGTMYNPLRISDRAEVVRGRVTQLRLRLSALSSAN